MTQKLVWFWISLFVVFYTFVGYGVLLYALVRVKRLFSKRGPVPIDTTVLPSVTVIVAAYNEAEIIASKMENTLSLDYPVEKLQIITVTDGSTDGTEQSVSRYPEVTLLHEPERKGKLAAVHRAMHYVKTDVVVFTDANTMLNRDALVNLCRHYADPRVGAVSGEKRVAVDETSDATAGEGFYWKYESKLKQWDAELHSLVGAAGELFSIRTALYEPVPQDAILDDFMISMRIAQKRYRVVYEPEAFAIETSSASVKEELKRKIRIAAGGIQSVVWLRGLLNPVRQPLLSFQYVSHRVLRWTITPVLLIALIFLNMHLAMKDGSAFFTLLLGLQLSFYGLALAGMIMEKRRIRLKAFFIPYYFCVMNYAVLAGLIRYSRSRHTAVWEKAERKKMEAAVS